MKQKIVIFGSTGSIGKQSLEVLREFPEKFSVAGLSALKNGDLLKEQAEEFSADFHLGILGEEAIRKLLEKGDMIINAIPGFDGLKLSVEALKAGKILLSANKESLAIAGQFLREISDEHGAEIRPLDSEASAIWQLMFEHGRDRVRSVTVTCSGGPFFGKTTEELANVTVAEALNHPTWQMGPKVSLDSATLINKVLEVYEVHNLFEIPLKEINIVIHRQSIAHGMIHLDTRATKMAITQNDMRLPISYALNYPDQPPCPWPIQRTRKGELNFDKPDPETFRSLKWLELHKGNPNFPIVLNALNEIASAWFFQGKIKFLDIYNFIEGELEKWIYPKAVQSLDELIALHQKITDSHELCNYSSSGKIPAGQEK